MSARRALAASSRIFVVFPQPRRPTARTMAASFIGRTRPAGVRNPFARPASAVSSQPGRFGTPGHASSPAPLDLPAVLLRLHLPRRLLGRPDETQARQEHRKHREHQVGHMPAPSPWGSAAGGAVFTWLTWIPNIDSTRPIFPSGRFVGGGCHPSHTPRPPCPPLPPVACVPCSPFCFCGPARFSSLFPRL